MKMRTFGKTGIEGSLFGIGCMRFPMKEVDGVSVVDQDVADEIIHTAIENGVNYFDTAYIYADRQSEIALGKALVGGYREKVYVATKLPIWKCENKEDMYRIFEEELQNLQTDYIDFYLVHSLNRDQWKRMKEIGVREFLDDLKAKGKIKFACFSFHDDYDTFEGIINDYDWDMCQIQYNYLNENDQAGIKGLELAGKRGIAVVIMEGLLGGKLSNLPEEVQKIFDEYPVKRSATEWAFRWICNNPYVSTVLSGVTNVEQTLDNCRIFSEIEANTMTQDEFELMDRARKAFLARSRVNCTACRYCVPCPQEIDIPHIFAIWNHNYRYSMPMANNSDYKGVCDKGNGADKCIECGSCESVCPQHLSIMELLKSAHSDMK